MYVSINKDGRIGATTDNTEYAEGMVEFDFPDDFNFALQSSYKIVDGELILDPPKATEDEVEQQRVSLQASQTTAALEMFVQNTSASFTDEQALQVSAFFKQWEPNITLKLNEIISYNQELYRCGQPELVTSEVFKPGDLGTEALYSHIKMDKSGYEMWQTFDGTSGIYQVNQIVMDPYNEKLYKSTIPNNVWGPPNQFSDFWQLYEG